MKEALKILNTYLQEENFVVVAVSGGPDSMALLHLLTEYKKKCSIHIICAHVNHQVRKESYAEEEFVKEYCFQNDVIFEGMRIEKYKDKNFHLDARNQRYAFFDQLIKKYNAKFLLTAHHGDDLMESILMRIVRGSTLKGYAGFECIQERKKYLILRPLIMETKQSILEYNQENQIKYVTDASNFKDVYTRNRYRKYVLPLLKNEDSFAHQKFLKFSETLLEADRYITKQVNNIFKDVYSNRKLNIAKIVDLDSFLQKKLIQKILEDLYGEDTVLLNDKHTQSILKLLSSNKNGMICLPKEKIVLKDRNYLLFDKNIDNSSYYYIFDKNQVLPNGYSISECSTEENSNFICRLNRDDIHFPLIIRTKKEGDSMCVKHMTGKKKIKDIFKDCKIPLEERENWPIVTDSDDKIVWIPGLKKSNFDVEKEEKCDIILRYY